MHNLLFAIIMHCVKLLSFKHCFLGQKLALTQLRKNSVLLNVMFFFPFSSSLQRNENNSTEWKSQFGKDW